MLRPQLIRIYKLKTSNNKDLLRALETSRANKIQELEELRRTTTRQTLQQRQILEDIHRIGRSISKLKVKP